MQHIFKHGFFPLAKNRNVLLYYIINIALNMWFIEAIWYFYWGRFASYTTIGLVFSVASFVQLLTTIPTGALADMFGQKKSVVVGLGILVVGSICIAGGSSILVLFIGLLLQSLGRSFISGALDALVYESVKEDHTDDHYANVIAFNTQATILSFALTVVFGGLLYSIYFRLAHILTTLAYLIAFGASFFMREVRYAPKSPGNRVQTFIDHHVRGFTELVSPSLRSFLTPIMVLFILMRMYDWGVSKPTIALGFGFSIGAQSVLYSALSIFCAYFVGQLGWFKKRMDDTLGIFAMGIVVSGGFLMTLFPIGLYGVFAMIAIEGAGRLSYAWVPAIINKRIASQYRATTLSTLDFVGRIPYMALNFLAGIAIDIKKVGIFHGILGAVGLLFLIVWYARVRNQKVSAV